MKHLVLAAALTCISCAALAQVAVTTEEHRQTTVRHNLDGSTTVHTNVIVRQYVTYLYDVYIAVGIPQAQIVQLINWDLDILDARIRGDWDSVRVIIGRQTQLVGVPVVQRIHTHVVAHPVPSVLPVYARPVWNNNVTVVNNNINIDIDVNKTEIQKSVQQNNVKVENLNISETKKAVESGKIEELKAGAAADAKAKPADATKPGETPKAGETPKPGDATKPGETPEVGDATKPGETVKPGETPKADTNVKPGETPKADADTKPGANANPTRPEDRNGDRGANPNPSAPPANANDKARENSQSPNLSATPAPSRETPASPVNTPVASGERKPGNPVSTPSAPASPGSSSNASTVKPSPSGSSNAPSTRPQSPDAAAPRPSGEAPKVTPKVQTNP